jgi:hypothetical protein
MKCVFCNAVMTPKWRTCHYLLSAKLTSKKRSLRILWKFLERIPEDPLKVSEKCPRGSSEYRWKDPRTQTTDMNLGQAPLSCFASTNSWFVTIITKRKKIVIEGFMWITKFYYQFHTLLQVKMAQQGKQMRVGACEGFAYHSVKLVTG